MYFFSWFYLHLLKKITNLTVNKDKNLLDTELRTNMKEKALHV